MGEEIGNVHGPTEGVHHAIQASKGLDHDHTGCPFDKCSLASATLLDISLF